jgi:acyl-CoA hydrolase
VQAAGCAAAKLGAPGEVRPGMALMSLPASACRAELAVVVRPRDLNTFQSVFGGYVMERVDGVATALVADVAGRAVVTAYLDRLSFRAGIGAFQRMRLVAQATRTFRTSMEVAVRVEGEDPLSGRRWTTAEAFLTVVGLDEAGRPAPLPQLVPGTPEEREAFEQAEARRKARLARGMERAGPEPVFSLAGPDNAERVSWERVTRLVHARHVGEAPQASAGWLLALADELAAVSASRHAGVPCVTAGVDDVAFLRPVPVGDVVTLDAYVTATFRTSMEVMVDIWRRPRYGGTGAAPAELVARCPFTFVALGPDGRPTPVRALEPQDERERALAEAARRRRDVRGKGAAAPRRQA